MKSRPTFVALAAILGTTLALASCGGASKPVPENQVILDLIHNAREFQQARGLVNRAATSYPGRVGMDRRQFSRRFDELTAAWGGGTIPVLTDDPGREGQVEEVDKAGLKREILAGLYDEGWVSSAVASNAKAELILATVAPSTDLFKAALASDSLPAFTKAPKVTNYEVAKDGRSFTVEVELPSGWDLAGYTYSVSSIPMKTYLNNHWSESAAPVIRYHEGDDRILLSGKVYRLAYAKEGEAWKLGRAELSSRTVTATPYAFDFPRYSDATAKAMEAESAAVAAEKTPGLDDDLKADASVGTRPEVPAGAVDVKVKFRSGEEVPAQVVSVPVLDPDKGGTYVVANLFDGNPTTAWCPKGGKGSFTIYFSKPISTDDLSVANGFQKQGSTGADLYHGNNRVRLLGIKSDRGAGMAVELTDEPNGALSYRLEPGFASNVWSLTFEVVSVYEGKDPTDVLLSELFF